MTPAELKQLQDYFAAHPNTLYRNPGGGAYTQSYSRSGGNSEGEGGSAPTLVGYQGGDGQEWHPNQQYQLYDTGGKQFDQFTAEDPNKKSWVDALPYIIATMGTAGAAGLLGAGASFGATGAAGAAGASAAGMGGYGSAALGADALGGAAGLSGTGAGVGASTVGAGFTPGQFATGFTDAGTAGGALDTAYTAGTAGTAFTGAPALAETLAPGAMPGGSSLLSGATAAAKAAAGSGLLGPALTAVGAVLGSKGNKQTSTSQHQMDPRLNGAVFDGPNALVPQTQNLLTQQMSPARQQGYLDMQKYGQGLLSQPIAGNGFSKFSGR